MILDALVIMCIPPHDYERQNAIAGRLIVIYKYTCLGCQAEHFVSYTEVNVEK